MFEDAFYGKRDLDPQLRKNDEGENVMIIRLKPDNEQIYYIVDAINDAINAGKQISFQDYDYTGLKKKVLKNKGEVYKLSPYKLLWSGDYYYVIGYSEKKGKVINFRVDRIAATPLSLMEKALPMPEDFYLENFTKEVSASPTFFGWVFGFGGKVQILGPESVKEQYRQMIVQEYEKVDSVSPKS